MYSGWVQIFAHQITSHENHNVYYYLFYVIKFSKYFGSFHLIILLYHDLIYSVLVFYSTSIFIYKSIILIT